MPNHVPVGQHVELRAELDNYAGASFLDVQQPLESLIGPRLDVDDRWRYKLHDSLDESELAVESFDVLGERSVLRFAASGRAARLCHAPLVLQDRGSSGHVRNLG